jgi:lipopolysaccharide biosynthesis glycosyltransferase
MKHAIFIAFDDLYFAHARRCLQSLERNYPNHPEILVCYDGIDGNVFAFVQTIRKARVFPPDPGLLSPEGIDLGVVNSPQVFIRYMLWDEVFMDFENILHLDADVVVLKPLDALFAENDFFAVCDYSPSYSIFKQDCLNNHILLDLLQEDNIMLAEYPHDMMNAGVFLMPRRYRSRKNFERLWDLTRRYNDFFMFADQSAISLWCHARSLWFSDDIRYNFQCAFFQYPILFLEDLSPVVRDIHIFHFARYKPGSVFYRNLEEMCKSFLNVSDAHMATSRECPED